MTNLLEFDWFVHWCSYLSHFWLLATLPFRGQIAWNWIWIRSMFTKKCSTAVGTPRERQVVIWGKAVSCTFLTAFFFFFVSAHASTRDTQRPKTLRTAVPFWWQITVVRIWLVCPQKPDCRSKRVKKREKPLGHRPYIRTRCRLLYYYYYYCAAL